MPKLIHLMGGETADCLEAEVGSTEGFERDLEISLLEAKILNVL